MSQSAGGASGRWTLGAVLVAGVWIVAFWGTPSPDPTEVKVEFGEPPQESRRPAITTPRPNDPEPVAVGDPPVVEPPANTPADTSAPSQPPPDSQPRVTPPSFYQYRLGQGETLADVASKFLGDARKWPVIAQANPLVDPNRLRPGTIVLVPKDPKNIQGVENPQGYETYTVASGDTLSDIAKKLYGRSSLWGIIAAANPEIDPNRLKVGSTLKIPPAPPSDPPN